jgi:hypothetical protein
MAIKLLGVTGTSLVPPNGAPTQDFLLINQPVFAFANVEDYEVVSRVLQANNDSVAGFFAERIRKNTDGTPRTDDPVTARALRTLGIIGRIGSVRVDGNQGAYAPPPAGPVEARYFSAAPFLFGAGRVAKFSAAPTAPPSGEQPDVADPNYLRTALVRRLTAPDAAPVEFAFQVQVRSADELADQIETEIEDACREWPEITFPFVTVATLTIPPQDFDTPDRRAHCEGLVFTPGTVFGSTGRWAASTACAERFTRPPLNSGTCPKSRAGCEGRCVFTCHPASFSSTCPLRSRAVLLLRPALRTLPESSDLAPRVVRESRHLAPRVAPFPSGVAGSRHSLRE